LFNVIYWEEIYFFAKNSVWQYEKNIVHRVYEMTVIVGVIHVVLVELVALRFVDSELLHGRFWEFDSTSLNSTLAHSTRIYLLNDKRCVYSLNQPTCHRLFFSRFVFPMFLLIISPRWLSQWFFSSLRFPDFYNVEFSFVPYVDFSFV